jgi:hypothetical protein
MERCDVVRAAVVWLPTWHLDVPRYGRFYTIFDNKHGSNGGETGETWIGTIAACLVLLLARFCARYGRDAGFVG